MDGTARAESFGLTELFSESSEPPFEEFPRELALLTKRWLQEEPSLPPEQGMDLEEERQLSSFGRPATAEQLCTLAGGRR